MQRLPYATHEIRLGSNALRISCMNKFTYKIAHGTNCKQKLADMRKKVYSNSASIN